MNIFLSSMYWEKVATPILFIMAVLIMGWTYTTKTPERTVVFDCDRSPDGLCFRVEYDGDRGECYTSSGVELGYCQVRDFLVLGGKTCVTTDKWCPAIYLPDTLKEKAASMLDLVVFNIVSPDGLETAYCHEADNSSSCFTLAGAFIGKGNHEEYADSEFSVCMPSYGDDCQLVPAMLVGSY